MWPPTPMWPSHTPVSFPHPATPVRPSPTLWPALPALPALPWPLQGKLQLLCMQLDRHINTCIRESPQAMHWTTLKDLAAQTHTRWQELLAQCQPQVAGGGPPPPPRAGGGHPTRPPPGLEGEWPVA